MTGPEYEILLIRCGLAMKSAAVYHQVRDTTLRKWTLAGPPLGAADEIRRLDAALDAAAKRATEAIEALPSGTPAETVLVAYASDADLARYQPDWTPPSRRTHLAMLGRVQEWAHAIDRRVRVVTLDPDAYEAWRRAEGLADDPDTRTAWASAQPIDD